MAFRIQDLLIDVMPEGEAIRRWADTIICPIDSAQCFAASDQQCQPAPSCKEPSHKGPRPKPKPEEIHTVPAGLLLLRQQLRHTLSQGR